jgi:hypothetical protein
MSPFKAAILDMIKAAPNGVSSAELRKHLCPPEAARTPSLIRVHIHGINELLGETDWRSSPIRRPGEGRAGFCTYAAGAARQAQLRRLDRECL